MLADKQRVENETTGSKVVDGNVEAREIAIRRGDATRDCFGRRVESDKGRIGHNLSIVGVIHDAARRQAVKDRMAFRPLVRVIDNVQRFPDASFVGQWQPAGWLARFVEDGLVQEHDRGSARHAPCELCESLRIARVLGMASHENYFPFRSWLVGEIFGTVKNISTRPLLVVGRKFLDLLVVKPGVHHVRLAELLVGPHHAQRVFQSPVERRIPSIPACTQATETADTHISHYNNVRCQLAATEVAGRLSDVTAYTLANETRPDTWQLLSRREWVRNVALRIRNPFMKDSTPYISIRWSRIAFCILTFFCAPETQAQHSPAVLASRWVTGLPSVVFPDEHNTVDSILLRTHSGSVLVAAESRRVKGSIILLSRSTNGDGSWGAPRVLTRAQDDWRITAGAAGTLASGRLVLACHEWQETPGTVIHIAARPAGVHHYRWRGFRRASKLKLLISDDEGHSWTSAVTDTSGGPLAAAAMGRVFEANGVAWLPVYGPSNKSQMDAALSGVGFMRSDDDGKSWRFSHWLVKAEQSQGIGYGPGEITVLPDGRWLGMLQGNDRGRGDYTRPRVCRTISTDRGRTWSLPEQKFLNHGTSTVTLDGQAGEEIMVGGWKDRGIMFTVGTNAGDDWLYQDQVWSCIWYAPGNRGGTRLLKLGDAVMVVYHWMGTNNETRTEVRTQLIRRAVGTVSTQQKPRGKQKPAAKWRMAEAYQLPHIPAAPAGIRIKTLLKLRSGDWICLGYTGSKKAGTAYGFAPTGVCVLRSPEVTGPWKKIADLSMPPEVGGLFDTGTGAGVPGAMVQHSTGRLLLPLSTRNRKDIILTCSDDEGKTWQTIGSMARITGMPAVHEADKIVERADSSLIFPLQRPFHGASKKHPLCYIISADRGRTWSAPVFWATHPGRRYQGLPHGPFADLRETSLAVLNDTEWLGIFRESRGTPAPENAARGPLSMPLLCLARSTDNGRSWKSSFGFLGVEPDIAALPGGAVMATYRDDNLASVWISYDQGAAWHVQHDPAELPWKKGAAERSRQWPPGGEPIIRVIDNNTVVVICDSGMIPSGKLLPPEYKPRTEYQGRVQIRFFRREIKGAAK